MISVCLPSDALLEHLLSYLGFSYLGCGVSLHCCSSKVQLEEAQAGIKISGRNINNLGFTDDTILMAESKEELKNLDESEREEKKLA